MRSVLVLAVLLAIAQANENKESGEVEGEWEGGMGKMEYAVLSIYSRV